MGKGAVLVLRGSKIMHVLENLESCVLPRGHTGSSTVLFPSLTGGHQHMPSLKRNKYNLDFATFRLLILQYRPAYQRLKAFIVLTMPVQLSADKHQLLKHAVSLH